MANFREFLEKNTIFNEHSVDSIGEVTAVLSHIIVHQGVWKILPNLKVMKIFWTLYVFAKTIINKSLLGYSHSFQIHENAVYPYKPHQSTARICKGVLCPASFLFVPLRA